MYLQSGSYKIVSRISKRNKRTKKLNHTHCTVKASNFDIHGTFWPYDLRYPYVISIRNTKVKLVSWLVYFLVPGVALVRRGSSWPGRPSCRPSSRPRSTDRGSTRVLRLVSRSRTACPRWPSRRWTTRSAESPDQTNLQDRKQKKEKTFFKFKGLEV